MNKQEAKSLLHNFWQRSSDACPLEATEAERQEKEFEKYVDSLPDSSRPSPDIYKVVEQLSQSNPWDRWSDHEDKADKAYLWDDYCKKLKELLNQSK